MAATAFPAAAIVSGTIATPRLGSGTADATSFLRGDQTWQPIVAGAAWGDITGTLSAQTDLQAALDAKIGGSSGVADNCILRADGTGGATLQSSASTIDDSGVLTVTQGGATAMQLIGNGVSGRDGYSTQLIVRGGIGCSIRNGSSEGISAQNFWSTGRLGFKSLSIGVNDYPSRGSDVSFARVSSTAAAVYTTATGTTPADWIAGAVTASGLISVGVYTFATVPSASSNTGKFLRISDRAQRQAYSDGTNWRFTADDVIIS